MRKYRLSLACALLTFAVLVFITLQATRTRADLHEEGFVTKCGNPSCTGIVDDPVIRRAEAAGLSAVILRAPKPNGDPAGEFFYDFVEGSTAFVAARGMVKHLRGDGQRLETLYFERFVSLGEVAEGFTCPSFQPWHAFHWCDGRPVTGYWQLTYEDPLGLE